MKNFEDLKKEWLKDPEFKREYDALGPEYEALEKMIKLRVKNKTTQSKLAGLMGTTQSAISRFEQGCVNPTLEYLSRYARVFGKRLVIDFR